ncbi:ArsR/SmtB family transcription factor [Amycolatopsis nigrescens]|uniref:ArsR/SmtB family transcription factor n=1 Tax=Amycolatopsis nigrescens TaxID=381445 RepID=UPI00037DBFDF|nr:winged helix-turn-helix domain-containing protein [Amycolatopsis nigrescens]
MLRIHFTAEDLGRIRLAEGPDPLWEVVLSLHVLQTERPVRPFDRWRRAALRHFTPEVRELASLTPAKGYSADFLTPATAAPGIDAGLAGIEDTPAEQLRTDISLLSRQQRLPDWAGRLAVGDRAAVAAVTRTVRSYYTAALAPLWPELEQSAAAERNRYGQLAFHGGLKLALAELHPTARWRGSVLELGYPVHQEVHLGGRGLILTPSYFCLGRPITFRDPGRPPTLVYPISATDSGALTGERPGAAALDALFGRGRARVLRAIAERPRISTTGLAGLLGISAAGASQHATVLRTAGLIYTTRTGGTARHSLTLRGRSLLR